MRMKTFELRTGSRETMVDITGKVTEAVAESGVKEGFCVVYVPHTTAAVTINEGADPDVRSDIIMQLARMVPQRGDFAHFEGNSDAHIKTLFTGPSVTLIVEEGKLVLGTWQKIFFCEFDGPRTRKFHVKIG